MKNLLSLKGAKVLGNIEQKSINGGIGPDLRCSKSDPTCPPGYGCVYSYGKCVWGA